MFRPKTPQQQPSVHRLAKQQLLPSVKDLEFAFMEATKRPNWIVELPWGIESSQSFLICVTDNKGEAVWALYQGDDSRGDPLWRHSTRDMALIHSLVFQSVPDDQVSGFGVSKTPTSLSSALSESGQHTSQGFAFGNDANASLQGKLENMQIATLVQSIQMSKMCGRLQILDRGSSVEMYFLDGAPVHAGTSESIGDQAVIEILTWEQGDFRFFPEETCEERTVQRRLENLILEGITLLDQLKFLAGQGVVPEAYILRKEQRISQQEFKTRVEAGIPLDMAQQMSFYEQIDNHSRLQDILARRPMMKTEWVPLLFNLTSCGLVTISTQSPLADKSERLDGVDIDPSVLQGVIRSLVRSDTGMFTYPAFLFLLEQEFVKSVVFGMPLSLLLFEARLAAGDTIQPLPIPALREAAARIEILKRPYDTLGHYETFDIAIFMPGTSLKVSRGIANQIASALHSAPLVQSSPARLLLAGGLAVCPEDTLELGKLIAAAREAKNKAKETGSPIKLYSEL